MNNKLKSINLIAGTEKILKFIEQNHVNMKEMFEEDCSGHDEQDELGGREPTARIAGKRISGYCVSSNKVPFNGQW